MTGTSGEQARPDAAEGTTGQHPAEYVLADYLDGLGSTAQRASIAAHLEGCLLCQMVIDRTGQPAPFTHVAPDSAPVQLPAGMVSALRESTVAAPAPGQLWRLRAPVGAGEELAVLVVVLRVDDDVLVAPATFDPQESTDLWTLQAGVLGTDVLVAVWVSLEQYVGWETLDVLMGTVEDTALRSVHRALRRGQPAPRELPLGRLVDEELSAYRALLSARLTLMSEARLAGPVWAEATDESTDQVDVLLAVRSVGWSIAQLASAAQISARDARFVLNGQATLTGEQAARVAAALNLDGQVTQGAPCNPGWAREVASPVFRPRFDAVAELMNSSGWELRRDTSRELVAARGSNDSAQDYHALVDQHLVRLEREVGLRD